MMARISRPNYEYQVGGSLPVDTPTYVIRKADEDFYASLRRGDFCYVLNSRQMGKSSLRVQVMQRLQREGFACAVIDITAIGTADITPEQWYAGVIDSLSGSFQLYSNFDLDVWWQANNLLSPLQRFSKFIETVLLKTISERIVIFIDEIDSILALQFNLDDFFAVIRDCYNRRADNVDYHRLTFALIGVSTPSDLIQDRRRTPFNIGTAIDLTGFQIQEVQPLAEGLKVLGNTSELMQTVLEWTGGQPFLTQKVCKLLLQNGTAINTGELVALIRKQIIENWETQDEPEHLRTIQDRMLRGGEKKTGRLLGLCQQILQQGQIIVDDSLEQTELRLTGLVVKRDGKLRIYNRIYAEVFNQEWCEKILAKLRPYADNFNAWVESERLDESRLLRGKTLQDAQEWAADKSLSDWDYQFLAASQDLETRVVKKRLEVEEQAKLVLVTANRKANQRIRFGSVVFGLTLVGAVASFIITQISLKTSNEAIATAKQAKLETDNAQANLKKAQIENEQISQQAKDAAAKRKAAEVSATQANNKFKAAQLNLAKASQQVNQKTQELQKATVAAQKAVVDKQQAQQQLQNAQSGLKEAFKARQNALKSLNEAKQQQQQAQKDLQTANIARQNALTATQLEQEGTSALRQFNTGREIDALLLATQTAGRLKDLVKDKQSLAEYPAYNPLFILQTMLLNIREQNRLEGHSNSVNNAVFSPDGKTLASASADNTIKLWNRETGKEITTFTGHNLRVSSVVFSPDGKTLASASADKTIKLWNRETGKEMTTLTGHSDSVSSVVFSPDGKTLASASWDNTIKLWNRETGKEMTTLTGHNLRVSSVVFSPDGKTLASASADTTIKLWNRETGKEMTTLTGHSSFVTSVVFSPDGKTLASASDDKTIKLWNRETGKEMTTLTGHSDSVTSVVFSPDDKTLASASWDNTIKLWNRETGKEMTTLTGHNLRVSSVVFSPDGKTLASASDDNTIKLWNRETGKEMTTLTGHSDSVTSVVFSPDGKTLASASWDNTIKLWNRETGKEITTFTGHNLRVSSVVFSPDGKTLASASADKTIKLWNRETGKEMTTLTGHNSSVNSVVFSPDGETLASASFDKTIKLWYLNLDDLLAQGCDYLEAYLASRPQKRPDACPVQQ